MSESGKRLIRIVGQRHDPRSLLEERTMRSTDAEIIKSRVTSRQLLEHAGVPVLQNGFACCPLHGERTASLKVYDDPRRGWHCFGCGRGGTVIDLGMALWNTDFLGACSMLNDEFQLGIPMGRSLTAEEKREFLERKKREQEARERKRRRMQEAETAYWAAYDAWLKNERTLDEQAPASPEEPISEDFADAAAHKAEIKEALELADEGWRTARDELWA